MEEKVFKWNRNFNFCKWAFIVVAILSLVSIIYTLITGEESVLSYVMAEIEVIIFSLFLAFIAQITTETKVDDEE